MKASIQDYYDTYPEVINATGDIWSGLPSYGLIKKKHLSGIVITPACDLQNYKTETITFLPILNLYEFFSLPIFCNETLIKLNNIVSGIKCEGILSEYDNKYHCSGEYFDDLIFILEQHKKIYAKYSDKIDKSVCGLSMLKKMHQPGLEEQNYSDLLSFWGGKEYKDKMANIVRNKFRSDIYFLPSDRQRDGVSAISKHSVVMFRYPISLPTDILDVASNLDVVNWQEAMDKMSDAMPVSAIFKSNRPMKKARLRERFLADLLSKYVSLYMRIGSPDMHERLVLEIDSELEGGMK